jgi:hypothetical protein
MGADQQISSIRAAVSGLLPMGWSPSGRKGFASVWSQRAGGTGASRMQIPRPGLQDRLQLAGH